jgi:cation diffusion facilitator family transporter
MAQAPSRGHDHGHDHGEDHDHGHDHGHGHSHGPDGHAHTHRSGIPGWLQHTFAHSHDVHEKVDDVMESNERGFWATKWALVSLGITTIIQVIIVWASGSTALFADTVHNLGDGANSIPLLIAFWLQRRARSRTFTYGYGRTEDLAGLVILVSIAASAIVAGYESIRKLIDPEPMSYLGWVAAAAIVGFIGNEAVALLQIRTGRQIGSAALIADGQHARIDGFTSLAVLVAVFGTLLGAPILDPIIGLLITVTIVLILWQSSRSIFRRMLDGIEPEILAEIEHAPMHVDGVRGVDNVRARWLGHKVHADLDVVVDRELSVADAAAITARVKAALEDHVPAFGGAVVSVTPARQG